MRWIGSKEIKGLPKEKNYDYAELLLEELHREDELFTSRFNLFLVAESLLFLSYATFLNILNIQDNINNEIIIIIVGLLAISITIIYSIILRRNKDRILEIRDNLEKIYPNYKRFVNMRECKGHIHLWLWRLSLLFLLAWIGLLLFSV